MSARGESRPGGRSARIQQAVHQAARALLAELPREELSVPRIAERAEVAPTTIYRRWGTLAELLSDVAADRIRAAPPPPSTGSLRGDLTAWARDFGEELSSGPGRGFVAALVAGDTTGANAVKCDGYATESATLILERHPGRPAPPVEQILERVVAPLIYRILFAPAQPLAGYAEKLVAELLATSAPAEGQR